MNYSTSSMAHLKGFTISRDTRRASKVFFATSALLFFTGVVFTRRNTNMLTIEPVGRPSNCYPQLEQEIKEETPTLNIQRDATADNELWRLLWCCVRHSSDRSAHNERLCGRYGCCPKSCYSNFANLVESVDVTSDTDKAFFVETSTSASLNYRQACTVESIARLNPHLNIYVLFTGDILDFSAPTSEALLDNYSNVHLRTLFPLGDFFKSTPMEHWYFCSGWNYGPYAVSHLSDALRFMTLYKYGGYYFDLDVIFISSLPRHMKNFIVFQNEDEIAAGTLHVDKGHTFAETAVREFVEKYSATIWGLNGPDVVRRTMVQLCRNETLSANETCQGVTMLPSDTFYPIPWEFQGSIFKERDVLPDLNTLIKSGVLGVHVWNKLSAENPVRKKLHRNQLYANLAATNCPKVFQAAPNLF